MLDEFLLDLKELLELNHLSISTSNNTKNNECKSISIKNTSYYICVDSNIGWKKLFHIKSLVEKMLHSEINNKELSHKYELLNKELLQALDSVSNVLDEDDIYKTSFSFLSKEIDHILIEDDKNINYNNFNKSTVTTSLKRLELKDEFSIFVDKGELIGFRTKFYFVLLQSKSKISDFIKNIVKIKLLWLNKIKEDKQFTLQNQELQKQSNLAQMGSMLSNITHQWKQPLNTISIIATGISIKTELGLDINTNSIKEDMETIVDKTNYLSNTMNTFSDFLKENKNKELCDLEERINVGLDVIGTVLEDLHITLRKDICKDKIQVLMPKGELPEVIINIISNAKDILIENHIEEPIVNLSLTRNSTHAIIIIEDNAGGIPEGILKNIFKAYFTTKANNKGTGLGLHMSHNIIVNSFGGTIIAKNSDKGAVFTIKIPIR